MSDHTSAAVICDNLSPDGVRITTFEVVFPRPILAEVNTHKVVAKSSASSRAIPVKKRIAELVSHAFVPQSFTKNQPGMQADESVDHRTEVAAREIWAKCLSVAMQGAAALDALGVHKQHANRLIEPFLYHKAVLTATEWDNFFALRNHKDAQPEFEVLARLMKAAMDGSVPAYDQKFHLPYVTKGDELALPIDVLWKVSAARCARTSYHSIATGRLSQAEEDVALCDVLVQAGHMSPFEHVGFSDRLISREPDGTLEWERPKDQRHFYGWIPYRTLIEGSKPCRRIA